MGVRRQSVRAVAMVISISQGMAMAKEACYASCIRALDHAMAYVRSIAMAVGATLALHPIALLRLVLRVRAWTLRKTISKCSVDQEQEVNGGRDHEVMAQKEQRWHGGP